MLFAFTFNAKSFATAFLVFFSFFPSRHFFWTDYQKLFTQLFIISYSLDTLKGFSIKIVPQVVICNACGAWHGLCTVTSFHSIQKSTRNSQKLGNRLVRSVSQWMLAEDSIVKTERNRVDKENVWRERKEKMIRLRS